MSKIIIIQSIPWSSYGQLDNLSKKVYFKEIRPAVYSQSVDNHAIFRAKRSTRINVAPTFTQYFWVLIDSSRPIPFKQRGMSHNACICNHGHQKLDSNRLTCEQITRFLCFSLREMSTGHMFYIRKYYGFDPNVCNKTADWSVAQEFMQINLIPASS